MEDGGDIGKQETYSICFGRRDVVRGLREAFFVRGGVVFLSTYVFVVSEKYLSR